MPQTDGTVLIDTEIDADGMGAGTKEVEAAARRMADSVENIGTKAKAALNKQVDSFVKLNQEYAVQAKKVDELRQKVEAYGNQKIPTEEYAEIQKQISQAEQKMMKLIDAQDRFIATGGKEDSNVYKRRQYDIEELANTIKYAEGELKDLEETGKAFTLGTDTSAASADMNRLAEAERRLADMNNRLGTSYSSIKGQVNDYKKSLLSTTSGQNKFNKSLKSTDKLAKRGNMSLGKMLKTSLLMSIAFRAFSAVMSGIKEGFDNLAQYSGTTNKSLSMLQSSLTQLKNSLATAFAPILNVVAPILSKFINLLSAAATAVGQLFAALTGQTTFTKAVAVQEDYAASLEDSASAAKDAEDAMEGYLSPLDEINKISTDDDSSSSGYTGVSPSDMFEEVEVDSKFLQLAEKIKAILGDIFTPFKEAWAAEGQATIEAAKYALSSLGELAKSVGSSILEVWTNGTGTQTLQTILQIAQNILITIGNIATRLNEAWNTNNIGTQIIQNIFNLLNSVLGTIERITSATADWAATLDFTPLLTSINGLLLALRPLTDNIGAGLEWFWNNILLPIAGWTIQEAVPTFLDMLSAGITAVNEVIEALKPLGTWLWDDFLQPFGAWTGNAIISALETITTLLGKFSEWASTNQQVIISVTEAVASFFAAWKIIELMSFIQQAGGVVAALNLIKNAVLGNVIAKIADKAETIALTALYAKDFLVGIAQTTAALVKQAAQFAINTAAKIADTAAQAAMTAATVAWNAVCTIATAVTTAFGAAVAFLTSPIGLVVLAIGALIAIGVLLYKNWDTIKEAAASLAEWLGEKWDWIKEKTSEIWNKIKTTVSNVWSDIKATASSIFTSITSAITNAWNSIKNTTSAIWNGIVSTIKSAINSVIAAINGMISSVISGLNSIFSGVNKILAKIPDSIPIVGGLQIPTITAPQIPYLASGAVIPPNSPFMAVLGDQKSGNNLEMPESLLRRIIREESGNSGGGSYRFSAQINRRVLFDEFIAEAKLRQSATGQNPLELA